MIVASGTGATGWARSIAEATRLELPLAPEERAVGYWVREPFPSIATATRLAARSWGSKTISAVKSSKLPSTGAPC